MSALINLLTTGMIGFVFGVASTWVAHLYQRKRDDIAWQREKEKLQQQFQRDNIAWHHEKEKLQQQFQHDEEKLKQQFQHDKDLLEMGYQQKLIDVENQKVERIREKLIQGLENPAESIAQLERFTRLQQAELWKYRSALERGEILLSGPKGNYATEPPSEEQLRAEAVKGIEHQLWQLDRLYSFLSGLETFLIEKDKKQS